MKYSFIHLSDIHMTIEWDYSDTIDKIVNILETYSSYDFYVLITGDLANSGSADEYDKVNHFFELLKSEAKKKKKNIVEFIFVPGNHDIFYEEKFRTKSVLQNMSDEEYFNQLNDEEKKYQNFLHFSSQFGLPHDFSSEKSMVIPSTKRKIGKFEYNFLLFNNSVYTTYKDPNNYTSQGSIFCPKRMLDSIKSHNNQVNIMLMHYPFSYFDDQMYLNFRDKTQYLTYVLSGHVHMSDKIGINASGKLCPVSSGYALHYEEDKRIGFSVLEVDEENMSIQNKTYLYSDNDIFVLDSKSIVTTKIRVPRGKNPLLKKEAFEKKLLFKNYETEPLNETFVFPELEVNDKGREKKRIKDLDRFFNLVEKNQVAIVYGYSQSGKTSLINKLFFDFDEIGIPVIMDFDFNSPLKEDELESFIKSKIENEYDDPYAWEIFLSHCNKDRIALVDNVIIDAKLKGQIDLLKKYFGCIILTTRESIYSANNISILAYENLVKENAISLNIKPMFASKRYELVKKRLNSKLAKTRGSATTDEINDLYQKVQQILDKYIGNDSNYPYFINKIVDSLINDSIDFSDGTSKMYTQIYRTYVDGVIMNVLKQNDDFVISKRLLGIIAFEALKEENFALDSDKVSSLINSFKKDKNVDFNEYGIVSKLLEGKVLFKNSNAQIGFCSEDFLSFFAAEHFSELINEDFDKYKLELDRFLEESYFNSVAKFISFVSNLSGKKVTVYLIEKAEQYINDHEDLDIVNMDFALRDKEDGDLKPLTRKEKEQIREKRHSAEADLYDASEEKYESEINDGKERIDDEVQKDFCRGAGYLEIISSIIPEIKTSIEYEQQKRCIEILFKLPAIVFYLDSYKCLNAFDLLKAKLKQVFYDIGKEISDKTAEAMLINFYRSKFLAVIDYSVSRAHTKLTEKDLRNKEFADNDTKKAIRLMSMMFDSNAQETFEKVSCEYFKKYSYNPFMRNCISLMVRRYVSWLLPQEQLQYKKDFVKIFFKNDDVVNSAIKELFVKEIK